MAVYPGEKNRCVFAAAAALQTLNGMLDCVSERFSTRAQDSLQTVQVPCLLL